MIKAGATITCVGSYQPHAGNGPAYSHRAARYILIPKTAEQSEAGDILKRWKTDSFLEDDFTGDLGATCVWARRAGPESEH
jgi:ornithine cyclodeaminase